MSEVMTDSRIGVGTIVHVMRIAASLRVKGRNSKETWMDKGMYHEMGHEMGHL